MRHVLTVCLICHLVCGVLMVSGAGAVHIASYHGRYVDLQRLLDSNPTLSLTAVDDNGNTALHYALIRRHAAIAELLLKRAPELEYMRNHGTQ